jgi:hypothetical protein
MPDSSIAVGEPQAAAARRRPPAELRLPVPQQKLVNLVALLLASCFSIPKGLAHYQGEPTLESPAFDSISGETSGNPGWQMIAVNRALLLRGVADEVASNHDTEFHVDELESNLRKSDFHAVRWTAPDRSERRSHHSRGGEISGDHVDIGFPPSRLKDCVFMGWEENRKSVRGQVNGLHIVVERYQDAQIRFLKLRLG